MQKMQKNSINTEKLEKNVEKFHKCRKIQLIKKIPS
jgi:hypothetical protein